jgi:hypothetical protein
MFSQIRRININKMASSIRKLSQCNNNNNKDVKYDMIISELQDVNSRLDSMMKFVMPAAGFYIGTGIGTFFVTLLTLLK